MKSLLRRIILFGLRRPVPAALLFRWILKKVMGLLAGRKQPADCR